MWISEHSNIAGNKKADNVAKLSHSSPKAITIPGFSYTDTKKNQKKSHHQSVAATLVNVDN